MNGLARRRTLLVGLCLCIAGCAAQKIPLEPFASDAANEAPPAIVTDNLQLSVDHGPPPSSPYAKTGAPAPTEPTHNRAATPAAFASASSRPDTARPETSRPATPPPIGDAASFAKVEAELQALGTIDAATQARFMEDLRNTEPALRPTLLQTFKAGIAFRQRASAGPTTDSPHNGSPEKIAAQSPATNVAPATNAPAANSAPANSAPANSTTLPTIPPEILAKLRTNDQPNPFSNLPLDALGGGGLAPRSGNSPGLALPTQTILQAAMAEAQRMEEQQSRQPPPQTVKVAMHLERDAEEPAAKSDVVKQTSATTDTTAAKESGTQSEASLSGVPGPWRESLQAAITGLEAETREAPHNSSEVSRHAWLRMLYLAAGRREEALKPIPGIAVAEQDFWSEQIYGLATYLDTEKLTDPAKRSAEARSHLAKAEKRLSEASTLSVKALNFCTEVSSYGVYEKFKDYRFKAGQPVILYCEVENFRSEESAKGFHTALRSSYQILDPQGRRVAEHDLALTEEFCQNERRDYFIRYFVSVPERIYDGKYTLQLTIVDTLSQKIGQSTIDFTVGEEKKMP